MKILTLVRHAKSSWDDKTATDFERVLNPRGQRDAPMMATRLVARDCIPDLILSSPAARAKATAVEIVNEINRHDLATPKLGPKLTYEQQIYEASPGTLLHLAASTDDSHHHLMLVGHNPGLELLAKMLNSGTSTILASGAVVQFALDCESWAALSDGDQSQPVSCKRLFHDFPKNKPPAGAN